MKLEGMERKKKILTGDLGLTQELDCFIMRVTVLFLSTLTLIFYFQIDLPPFSMAIYKLCVDIWFSVYPMIEEVQEECGWGKCSSGLGFKCQDSYNLAHRIAFSIWQDPSWTAQGYLDIKTYRTGR